MDEISMTVAEIRDALERGGYQLHADQRGGYRIGRGGKTIAGSTHPLTVSDVQAWIAERGE